MMERKIKLKSVNPHITCFLCKGYLIDATTITECLHTFCKSCLVKYLEENNTCPSCKNLIHQSHPLNFISHDRTMQDIVYKLVPNLQEREQKRQEDFYRSRGIPFPRALAATDEAIDNAPPEDQDCHRSDEQVNICLEFKECKGQKMKALKRKFIRCSINATITQIKKFVALKVLNNACKFKDVDILCNDEILGKDHTLKFVAITRWRQKIYPSTVVLGLFHKAYSTFVKGSCHDVVSIQHMNLGCKVDDNEPLIVISLPPSPSHNVWRRWTFLYYFTTDTSWICDGGSDYPNRVVLCT